MYRTEEFKNKTTMRNYVNEYEKGEGFLEYCKKLIGHSTIWSCPLYDFNPAGYRKKYKYFYIIGKKLIFDQITEEKARKKDRERYISVVCQKEKEILTKKIRSLEEKYPNSVSLTAGSCHVCSQCKRADGGGCRYSDDVRCFIELLGGSVGDTANDLLGIEIQWMKQRAPESLTLVNGFLTDAPKVEI